MSRILVTGASGQLGRLTLRHLLKRVPSSQLIGLARDPSKAMDLAAEGVEIRKGDYFDYPSLLRAFEGVEKLMLIATHAFTDRNTQHYNAITAARQAGVRYIVLTSILRKEGSGFVLPETTVTDIFAEQAARASGVPCTIIHQPPFYEIIQILLGEHAYEDGIRIPAGDGKVAPATREEMAEAQAIILTQLGHEGKIINFSGSDPMSLSGVAAVLSEISGKVVPFVEISDQDYIARQVADGLPRPMAEFALANVRAITTGEFSEHPGELARLLGRRTATFREYLQDYPVDIPELKAIKAQTKGTRT